MNDSVDPVTPFFSRPAGKIFIIWLAMTIVGVLIGLFAPSHLMPRMLSTEGHTAVVTVVIFTVLAAPVAAFVYAAGLYSLLAWRHKGDPDEPPPDGPAIHGNTPMSILWLTVSSVLCVVLLVWGLTAFAAEQTAHSNTLQVDVTGQQWVWTFSYPGTKAQSRTLEVPMNRPVQFNITSDDVTHGFWIPQFGVQVDANPGVVTVIRATPNKMGGFVVRCSQLCGLFHSEMFTAGAVVSPATFAHWLTTQGASVTSAQTLAEVR